jgi:putative membrane protein
MRKMGILLAGAMALAGCSSNPPPAPAVAVDPTNPLFAPGYMAMAGSSDQFEIQSGQLALQMSQNPAVRNLAQMLITDHTNSTQMVVAAAQSAGLNPPPPAILPQHQALLDQERAAGSGAAFDMAFQQVQIQAHQQALTLHQNYAASGDVPALRTVAGQIVPVVQTHLNALQTLSVAPPPPPPPPVAPPPASRSGERG